jgi:hypothetical protein
MSQNLPFMRRRGGFRSKFPNPVTRIAKTSEQPYLDGEKRRYDVAATMNSDQASYLECSLFAKAQRPQHTEACESS